MTQASEEIIEVNYIKSKDFRYQSATGAWGGANPQGEIIINFFIEREAIPEKTTLHIDKATGKTYERKEQTPQKVFERELQSAIVLRADIARSVGEWLVRQADSVLFKQQAGNTSKTSQ